ncbi:MAG: hypothetical protein JO277_13510, partial [Candidatus Eremiobacteraeota bacterium]|nr:hypothetical protein [Candidatus Eremiobacteraeota bacterium]
MNVRRFSVPLVASCAFAACTGGGVSPLSPGPMAHLAAVSAAISLSPKTLKVEQGQSETVVVSESNYTGVFKATSSGASSCKGKATFAPAQGRGPKLTVKVAGEKPGSCTIAFSDASKHVAKLPVTVLSIPLDFVYVVNYNSNDVAQYAFNSDATMTALAPNYKLPPTCAGPDAIAMDPAGDLAFISCYATGTVFTVKIDPVKRTVGPSSIAPVAVPSPYDVIAPDSGAKNVLYADGGGTSTGTIAAFTYGTHSLTSLGAYTTPGVYPDEMALYTNAQGSSTLFVASPFDPVNGCTNNYTSGAVEQWSQDTAGHLTPQTSIPVCNTFYNVIAAGGYLYWAGPSVFGGYSLLTNSPLPSASPPWPAYGGPGYNPAAMSVIPLQPKPSQTRGKGPASAPNSFDYGVYAGKGNIYIGYSGEDSPGKMIPLAGGVTDGAASCTHLTAPVYYN